MSLSELQCQIQARTRLLLGDDQLMHLANTHVLIAGLGGVGGHCLEAIVRAGIGKITLVDFDRVDITNLNRQLLASMDTIDELKVEIAKKRMLNINPELIIDIHQKKLEKDNVNTFLDSLSNIDVVIDCIDQFDAKCQLLSSASQQGMAVFSSMGAGRRIDPSQVRIADISKTKHCGLARKIRQQLRQLGIQKGITTVFSEEMPIKPANHETSIGSISYLPAIFGQMLAGAVISSLIHLPVKAEPCK